LSDWDAHLLKSGVPQASDWLRLWKAVTSTSLSLRSLQELCSTDSFVSCDTADPKAVTREACLNMINIFVDLIRDEKRASTDDKSAQSAKKPVSRIDAALALIKKALALILFPETTRGVRPSSLERCLLPSLLR